MSDRGVTAKDMQEYVAGFTSGRSHDPKAYAPTPGAVACVVSRLEARREPKKPGVVRGLLVKLGLAGAAREMA